ncbi:MAG: 16S rRNA (guanine(527)-N(7))-methyltransferase RsmG [Chloroflexota bacterium]|nr:16S rRNA (guanine(527)-N(7))-methyltransferase RsmG [Chloroflexota bacterium]
MDPLVAGARELGITLTNHHLVALETYYRELVAWNERFNLTAITDWEGVMIRHFLDSLSCLKALPRAELATGTRVIDVGTGAGFPGLLLKTVCPGMQLTLLEATGKKVTFLEHVVRVLGLRGVEVIHGRAEELGRDPAHREQYDWALARAVAEMPTLAEYMLPLVRVGGAMLAQKGEGATAEVHGADTAILALGGRVRQLVPVELRGLAETRYLVVVDKIAATLERYPRRPGVPHKRPLR